MREAMRRSRRPQPPAPAPPTRVQARSIRGDAVAAGRGAAVLGSDLQIRCCFAHMVCIHGSTL